MVTEKDKGLGESSPGTCVLNHMKTDCPLSILERWSWGARKMQMLGEGEEEEEEEIAVIFLNQ